MQKPRQELRRQLGADREPNFQGFQSEHSRLNLVPFQFGEHHEILDFDCKFERDCPQSVFSANGWVVF